MIVYELDIDDDQKRLFRIDGKELDGSALFAINAIPRLRERKGDGTAVIRRTARQISDTVWEIELQYGHTT